MLLTSKEREKFSQIKNNNSILSSSMNVPEDSGLNFSFGKQDNYNENKVNNNDNTPRFFGKDVKNFCKVIPYQNYKHSQDKNNNKENFVKNPFYYLLARKNNTSSMNNLNINCIKKVANNVPFNKKNSYNSICDISTKPKFDELKDYSSSSSLSTVDSISTSFSNTSLHFQNSKKNINNNNIYLSINNNKNNNFLLSIKDKETHKTNSQRDININNNNNCTFPYFDLKNIDNCYNKNFISESQKRKALYIKKIFEINEDNNSSKLPYEIEYFLTFPNFTCDFFHEKNPQMNYDYLDENFIDILLSTYRRKTKMNVNENFPLKNLQKEISFSKRNILLSWLTEINFKYIKNQNILFLAMNLIDKILYLNINKSLCNNQISIKDFQLFGIICLNLTLKMENIHKVFDLDEIIALIGRGGGNNNSQNLKACSEGIDENSDMKNKIKNFEVDICDMVDFTFETSSSILILKRLIQLLNIQNKNIESIFSSICEFFLEISLYEEKFLYLNDFVKVLSSMILTKEILLKNSIKIGFHDFFKECKNAYKKEIKNFFVLTKKTIQEIREYKFGKAIFFKYQHKENNQIIDKYLNEFINECALERTNDQNKSQKENETNKNK